MDMESFFHLYYTVDLKRRFPGINRKIKQLEAEQREEYETLNKKQFNRLKKLLIHAYENCPYYNEIFTEAQLDPYTIKDWNKFSNMPILKKKDIQNHTDRIIAKTKSKNTLFKDATGGSTGEPLIFYHDKLCKEWFEACTVFVNSWWGIKPWFKKAYLWGADRDIPDLTIKERLKLKLERTTFLNSFDMDEVKMKAYSNYLKKERPQYVQGYASSLYLFSKFLEKNSIFIPKPKAVRSSAETLTPDKREIISRVFGENVFDFYGSREVTNIAAECPSHDGLHILSPVRYVEVLDSNDRSVTNKPGRVVVTDLVNYSMPFIRYEIGDVGILSDGKCACGRSFPKLERIVGRSTDFIQTVDDRYIHGEYFTHLFYGIKDVSNFQVHQKTLDTLYVYIVQSNQMSDETIDYIRENIKSKMGSSVNVYLEFVDNIPLTQTGKQRFTISDVPPQI